MEPNLVIDEQICATKINTFMKQFNPMKLHKWGFKIFVLGGTSGFAYDFEIYSGQENMKARTPGEPDLGSSANVVVRLSRSIPSGLHHRLF